MSGPFGLLPIYFVMTRRIDFRRAIFGWVWSIAPFPPKPRETQKRILTKPGRQFSTTKSWLRRSPSASESFASFARLLRARRLSFVSKFTRHRRARDFRASILTIATISRKTHRCKVYKYYLRYLSRVVSGNSFFSIRKRPVKNPDIILFFFFFNRTIRQGVSNRGDLVKMGRRGNCALTFHRPLIKLVRAFGLGMLVLNYYGGAR